MKRENKILEIRPSIEIEKNGNKHPDEDFMHATLRPILKLQHDILLSHLESEQHLNQELLKGISKTKSEKRAYLTGFIQKNNPLKYQLIGMTTGLFTLNETAFYLTNRKTVNKRILEMSITRFLSTYA